MPAPKATAAVLSLAAFAGALALVGAGIAVRSARLRREAEDARQDALRFFRACDRRGVRLDAVPRPDPSPAAAFPLDAEQIVRGLGFLASLHFDRTRKPGDDPVGQERMTLAIGRFLGVPLPVGDEIPPINGRIARGPLLWPYGIRPAKADDHATADAVRRRTETA